MIYYISRPFLFSLSFLFKRERANCRRDFVGEVRGRKVVEALLRLRRRQHLDAHLHRPVFRLRERNLLLQVSKSFMTQKKIHHRASNINQDGMLGHFNSPGHIIQSNRIKLNLNEKVFFVAAPATAIKIRVNFFFVPKI